MKTSESGYPYVGQEQYAHYADMVKTFEKAGKLEGLSKKGFADILLQQPFLSYVLGYFSQIAAEEYDEDKEVIQKYTEAGAGLVYSILENLAGNKPLPVVQNEGLQSMGEDINRDMQELINICFDQDPGLSAIVMETYIGAEDRGELANMDFGVDYRTIFLQSAFLTQFFLHSQFEKDQFRTQMGE